MSHPNNINQKCDFGARQCEVRFLTDNYRSINQGRAVEDSNSVGGLSNDKGITIVVIILHLHINNKDIILYYQFDDNYLLSKYCFFLNFHFQFIKEYTPLQIPIETQSSLYHKTKLIMCFLCSICDSLLHALRTHFSLSTILNKQYYFTKGTFFPCLGARFLLFDTMRSTGFFTTFSIFFTLLARFFASLPSFSLFPSFLVKTHTKKP